MRALRRPGRSRAVALLALAVPLTACTAREDEAPPEDSDGNAVPDFVETDLGYDPLVDCAQQVDCPGISELGVAPLLTEQNVLLILDSSGSMAGADGAGNAKIDSATVAVERYVVGTPDVCDTGVMVYGHRGCCAWRPTRSGRSRARPTGPVARSCWPRWRTPGGGTRIATAPSSPSNPVPS